MAKYRMVAALFAPEGNYDETTDPKAVADFKVLDKAYVERDIDTMHNILTGYGILDGPVEEYNSDCEYSIQADVDGYYLFTKISE